MNIVNKEKLEDREQIRFECPNSIQSKSREDREY